MSLQAHVQHGDFGKQKAGIKAPYFDGTQPCAQTDPELFFPENAGEANRTKRVVKQICGHCEFQADCLEYGLTHDVFGIWGGMLDSERRMMKRKRLSA
jgi:WhiB family redox-sensing transcriptional regulator